jgi:tetracycline resistance efflux pump
MSESRRLCIAVALLAISCALAHLDLPATALWPSIAGLTAVFLTQNALTGLLIGSLAGSLLLTGGNPVTAFAEFFSRHLIPALQSKWNLSVLIFTLLLGGFSALIEAGRGLDALLQRSLNRSGSSGRRVEFAAFGLGILCFFDGLASCLLTGRSVRPLADRARVPREKLAYIVDSTGSAVACVAIMSTWIAFQLSMIREGYRLAGAESAVNPFELFLRSIPLNFYCWFSLLVVGLSIWKSWAPGPMRNAIAVDPDMAKGQSGGDVTGAWRAGLPLLFLMGGLPVGLIWSGANEHFGFNWNSITEAFGAAQADDVLLRLSVLACVFAWLCNRPTIKASSTPGIVFANGVGKLFGPCLILIAAWCLSSTLRELGAANVLASMLGNRLPLALLPLVVFLLGTLTSFTTGTSWGTMGVLMPLALPATLELAGPESALIPAVVAAVFSGAVFGDHCSPLSDTTIISAVACDVDPLAHVRTQLPYALIAAGTAALLGFLPAGFGIPGPVGLALGAIALTMIAFRGTRTA